MNPNDNNHDKIIITNKQNKPIIMCICWKSSKLSPAFNAEHITKYLLLYCTTSQNIFNFALNCTEFHCMYSCLWSPAIRLLRGHGKPWISWSPRTAHSLQHFHQFDWETLQVLETKKNSCKKVRMVHASRHWNIIVITSPYNICHIPVCCRRILSRTKCERTL